MNINYKTKTDLLMDEIKADMTWEEFCEKAKKLGAATYKGCVVFHGWLFYGKDKYIRTENDGGWVEQEIMDYDEMLAVMEVWK